MSFLSLRASARRFRYQDRKRGVAAVALALLCSGVAAPSLAAGAGGADAHFAVPMVACWKNTTQFFANNAAQPVVAGDTVFFAAGTKLYAADLASGATKWQYPPDVKMDSEIETTPATADGVVYFVSGDALYALNAADGKQHFPPYRMRVGIVTAPFVIDKTVFFGGGDGKLYGVNSATGEAADGVWRNGVVAGPDISSDVTVSSDTFYYLSSGLDLHAMNARNGTPRWTVRLPSTTHDNAIPVLNGDVVLVAAGNTLVGLRTNHGEQRLYVPLPTDASTPPAVDAQGNIYIVTADLNVYALDRGGRGLWHRAAKVDDEPIAQPVVVNGVLLVGTTQGKLYAFDAATGATRWIYQFQPAGATSGAIPEFTNVGSSPVVAGDTLLVLTDDGTVTAFRHDLQDKTPPMITDVEPAPGVYMNGRPPTTFSARITDEGCGLDPNSVTLKIDDQLIPRHPQDDENYEKPGFDFNTADNTLDYFTTESETGKSSGYADGHHTVAISARDWLGNTATKSWTFTVDDTIPHVASPARRSRAGRPGGSRGGRGGAGSR
jgi:outer membrane protein assembly factor BamB